MILKNAEFLDIFILRSFEILCSAELNMKKIFITSGPARLLMQEPSD